MEPTTNPKMSFQIVASPKTLFGKFQKSKQHFHCGRHDFTHPIKIGLVVEPTPLKNMLVKMGSSSTGFGVKIPKNI